MSPTYVKKKSSIITENENQIFMYVHVQPPMLFLKQRLGCLQVRTNGKENESQDDFAACRRREFLFIFCPSHTGLYSMVMLPFQALYHCLTKKGMDGECMLF